MEIEKRRVSGTLVSKSVFALVLAFASAQSLAEAYVGATIGSYRYAEYGGFFLNFEPVLEVQGLMLGAHAGYAFNDWIGVEAAFQNYSSASDKGDNGDVLELQGDSLGLYLRPSMQVGKGMEAFLKLGVAKWNVKSSLQRTPLNTEDAKDTGTDFAWALGLRLRAHENWSVSGEVGGIEGSGVADLATFSFSMGYHF